MNLLIGEEFWHSFVAHSGDMVAVSEVTLKEKIFLLLALHHIHFGLRFPPWNSITFIRVFQAMLLDQMHSLLAHMRDVFTRYYETRLPLATKKQDL